MNIWQIAAGDGARDYTDLFLTYDVMLIGPGNPGDFMIYTGNYQYEHMSDQIERFSKKPKAGDLILLRYRNKVIAVGKIPAFDDQYKWNDAFEDVLGWDLQHTRRVIWDTSCLQIFS